MCIVDKKHRDENLMQSNYRWCAVVISGQPLQPATDQLWSAVDGSGLSALQATLNTIQTSAMLERSEMSSLNNNSLSFYCANASVL